MMIESNLRGSISETAVTLDLMRRGYNVLMPTVVSRYDLLVEAGDRNFIRVQVKTARIDNRDGNLKATWDRPYSPEEVDVIAIYDPTSNNVFYIPLQDIPCSKGVTLRINRYKRNTTTTALKAEDYTDFPLERVIAS